MLPDIGRLLDLCRRIGTRADYFQGGGGNVSVKIGDDMWIKASGRRIDDTSAESDLARVSYLPIKDFYQTLRPSIDTADLIATNGEIVSSNTKTEAGDALRLRPSMEVGFHSLLDKFVIHSHSVYANILNCAVEGADIITDLFPKALIVPYELPGAPLTRAIMRHMNDRRSAVIFLANHGLIVSSDDGDIVSELHETVNERLRQRLGIQEQYPVVTINRTASGTFESASAFLKETVSLMHLKDVSTTLLFPDQAVYMDKLHYNEDTNGSTHLRYSDDKVDALAQEETLVAWVYIVRQIDRLGFTLKPLSESDRSMIIGLESEKYRKSVR